MDTSITCECESGRKNKSMLKALLSFYKANKVILFRIKLLVIILFNILLVYLIGIEVSNPLNVLNMEIKGIWLENIISMMLGFCGYTIGMLEMPLVTLKLIFLLGIFVLLNMIIVYFNILLFVGLMLYMSKICYKIYTNFLINKENMEVLGLKLEHILSQEERQAILNNLLNSDLKIHDPAFYNELCQIAMNLDINDKNIIIKMILNRINEYSEILKQKLAELNNVKIDENTKDYYIQGVLDGIWGYMTPSNILIGVTVIGVVIFIIWANNNFTGSATTNLMDQVANSAKSIEELQKQQDEIIKAQLHMQTNMQMNIGELRQEMYEGIEKINELNETMTNIYDGNFNLLKRSVIDTNIKIDAMKRKIDFLRNLIT